MDSVEGSSELIFQIRGNNVHTEEILDENTSDNSDVNILSILYKNEKVGAAYFNCQDKTLHVYEEVSDLAPQFFMTCCIYKETSPKYLLTIGKITDDFVKHLIDLVLSKEETVTTDTMRSLPADMFLLSSKDYSFDICRSLLSELHVGADAEKDLYVNSFIDFDDKLSVYATGVLVKYLDKNWAHFMPTKSDLDYLQLYQVSLKGHLLMDHTTLIALRVFQQCSHESSFKRGLESGTYEGMSIYKLFSSTCKSKLGQRALRKLLLQPLNDINELTKRLDFISFVLHPRHQEFVESLQDNIKNLTQVSLILIKIRHSRASCVDWKILYKAIYHALFVRELSAPYQDTCEIIHTFYNCITNELIALENSINNALDFSNKMHGRPVIKLGLDDSLDAKKLRRQDITQHVNAAAKLAAQQLPDYLNECAIIYLPEMGHLISVKEWEPNCDPEALSELGFHFVFAFRDNFHYKNPLCLEMDETLGDINAEIIAHENRILKRLSSFIVKYNKDIREPLAQLARMDALIAIAKVSAQNNYIRPSLNLENVQEIQDCRHPLLELVDNVESNDFLSGRKYSHIKIVTGPNGSGKTIYLKEVALCIYLAHVGAYIPAKVGNIGMLHSIHSRMQASESASVRLSAFMIDAIQATQAANIAAANSLIFMDEFGRGTTTEEGLALLVAVLKSFHKRGKDCPHIVVSTHQQNVSQFLPKDALIEYLMMDYREQNGALSFLFKTKPGISKSFAFEIAAQVGIDESIIKRARQLFESRNIKSTTKPQCALENINDFFNDLDIPDSDPE